MFTTAIVFIAILSILVFIHELGHFLAARFFGVNVEEFGFGLPPRIWGKKIKNTLFSLNWLPIGGFVKLSGEDNAIEKGVQKQEHFFSKSKKIRSTILLAGVAMNFFLAVGITTYLLTQGVQEPTGRVRIERVDANGPAQAAGLQENDVLVQFHTPKELISYISEKKGQAITLAIERDGKTMDVALTPRIEIPEGQGPLGVAISDLETRVYPLSQAPLMALKINLTRAKDMFVGIGGLFAKLLRMEPVGQDVAGPIGIAAVTGQAVKFGFKAVLEFMSILSLNLAVLNVLPIPALDGGRFAFVVFEKLFGRKARPAFEQSAHQIGMIVLFILIFLISINDILRLARGG